MAQALLPPLIKAVAPATVILKGGTHVPWSPPAHYLSHVFLPALAAMGAEVEIETDGLDEAAAMDALQMLVNDKFGEGQ